MLGLVAAAVLLAAAIGCATPDPRASTATKAWSIEPQIGVTHAMQAGEAYYTLGRYHDGAQEWGKAAVAYRKAIAADAQSIEAYNALGVALARTGRHAEAEATLRQAVALAPDRAHVRNNLGYVLVLAGKPAAAIRELEAAVTLDAGDTVARANLRDALARSDAGRPDSDAPTEQPALPPAVLHVAEAAAPPPVRPPRLEISNGNGVAGMAAKVGRWLATHQGMRTDRLTNQKPFVQRDTIVQYSEGHADAATRVARALPLAAQPAAEPSKGLSGDLRVVLGRDWAEAPHAWIAAAALLATPVRRSRTRSGHDDRNPRELDNDLRGGLISCSATTARGSRGSPRSTRPA